MVCPITTSSHQQTIIVQINFTSVIESIKSLLSRHHFKLDIFFVKTLLYQRNKVGLLPAVGVVDDQDRFIVTELAARDQFKLLEDLLAVTFCKLDVPFTLLQVTI